MLPTNEYSFSPQINNSLELTSCFPKHSMWYALQQPPGEARTKLLPVKNNQEHKNVSLPTTGAKGDKPEVAEHEMAANPTDEAHILPGIQFLFRLTILLQVPALAPRPLNHLHRPSG
jgi:hypothetical protein